MENSKHKTGYSKATLRLLIVASVIFVATFTQNNQTNAQTNQVTSWWEVQSIDTMKYSRDLSREVLNDPTYKTLINTQIEEIANAGATHVAIGTPYDDEFIPVLKIWVQAARDNNLHVWFRGNLSGWEGWFEYPKISREQHTAAIKKFILNNSNLFEDGDIFTSCPECENGGPGDPRNNGDLIGHRNFLIKDYMVTKEAFEEIGKNVISNYYSMNGDVARLVMDKETTEKLGGIIVIDHYVRTSEGLAKDVREFSERTGAKIVLGEMGAPIPDLHGNLNETQQKEWLEDALDNLSVDQNLIGINYWTSVGGTTELWYQNMQQKEAVKTITAHFKPKVISGKVQNELGNPIKEATVSTTRHNVVTDKEGKFTIPHNEVFDTIIVSDAKHISKTVLIDEKSYITVSLEPTEPSFLYRIRLLLKRLFNR